MAFEQRLVQSQTQKLILSPQIKQYIKLLQLPLIELQTSVEQELAENPALEEDPAYSMDLREEEAVPEVSQDAKELDFQQTFEKLEHLDDEIKSTMYSDSHSKLESIEDLEKKHSYKESLLNKETTLCDYLLWQLRFLSFSDEEIQIAQNIIGNIDPNGYMTVSVEELSQQLAVEPSVIEAVLSQLQKLDPPGVCARNLQECLLLQLSLKEQDVDVHLAQAIIKNHFKLLEKKDIGQIARALSISEDKVRKVCTIITSLEPKPGRVFFHDEATTITPDASVYLNDTGDGYTIEIHDERIPQLRINRKYREMLKDKTLDAKTREYLKSKINAAFWFMKAIDQRKSTLRDITERIVAAQADFFERGFAFLRPLRLKDIAAQIGIHESTVSRALSNKYINTPQGTIPYKMFFSNKMETDDGSFESQKSIMEKIKFIIENEDPKKPFSDSKLVTLMKARGIQIARRTVAKYREMLRILPSHMRRQK